jgi:hypothetical protein
LPVAIFALSASVRLLFRTLPVAPRRSSGCAACRATSARVPLRRLDALPGSFTPSMANISRPISPCRSQTASTAAKMGAMSAPSVLTHWAIVVTWGRVSPQSAMNVTCSAQARAIARLLTIPRE